MFDKTLVNSSIAKNDIVWSVCKEAERLLGVKPIENIDQALLLTRLLESILSNPKPPSDWYDLDHFKVVKRLYAEARERFEHLEAETKNILARFDREILDVDYSAMLRRFKTEYTSFVKFLKKSYWTDKKAIQSLSKEIGQKFTDEAIIQILYDLKMIGETQSWVEENDEVMTKLFGGYFLQGHTDWQALAKAIDNFEFILKYFGPCEVTQQVRVILSSSTEIESLNQKLSSIKTVWEAGFIDTLNQTLAFTTPVESVCLSMLRDQLKHAKSIFYDLSLEYGKMCQYNRIDVTFQETIDDFNRLQRVQDIAGQINGQSEQLRIHYQYLYNGMDTNWEAVLSALSWTNEFIRIIQKYTLPRPFIERICKDQSAIRYAQNQLLLINQGCRNINNEWAWFISLFKEKDELLTTELSLLHRRLEKCLLNLASLEEWVDFSICRERCNEAGLSAYIDRVQGLRIASDLIVPTFLKRFYRLWLDSVLPGFQSVYSFRRRSQDELVQDFKKLDVNQYQIARARIKELLLSRLPDIHRLNGPVDEVSILMRELSKQRRIMPLRKLFGAIPNLLLTLKPCLMMSPLSVSLFLEAKNYQFDIVIFDEASQVRTEDAIGAIIRGKQIIIAGDTKQLPPTNFFSANTTDGDFDTDEEDRDDYDDSDGYESVLDEAVTVLPSRTLLWHYRSRHEHLIAFSNAKIYNQQLITFPSIIDRLPDHGVEYIEVENGIYERSGRRSNVNEARRVGEIVFEQILKYPKRSMGIVTFSEAQQQAVEVEIRRLRIKTQQYEWYFAEDKEEAFFVKNLENVQGDERDTIIFSIGYAKDHNGVMHMNFGPLSKSGGYRRLNVAITRAKFNVKLVGSIKPTDIDLDKTSSEGVRMLRSYIEFAMRGPEILKNEIIASETVYTDSPFEEAVYDFLVNNGYRVATQVGCSGYRIDLAVKHPSLSGRYVIGIECDGASYHSARTARERDRLRQMVLEDIGWKIYRIWSTDWVKDPITEGQKLLDAVKLAIDQYSEDNHVINFDSNDKIKCCETGLIPGEIIVASGSKSVIDNENPYGFEFYEEADVYKVKRKSREEAYLADVIRYIVQREYPVHIEVVYKRVLCLLPYQRVSMSVRIFIYDIIKKYLSKDLDIRESFLWPTGEIKVSVRASMNNGSNRKIDQISVEELAEAMFIISKKSFGILHNDLYQATARTFGFNRTGGNIHAALDLAYNYLISMNRVENNGGKITACS